MGNVINTKRKSVSSLSRVELRLEMRRIDRKVEWIYENYSGCDWCDECGGGYLQLAALGKRRAECEARLAG